MMMENKCIKRSGKPSTAVWKIPFTCFSIFITCSFHLEMALIYIRRLWKSKKREKNYRLVFIHPWNKFSNKKNRKSQTLLFK
jgi:hypothetical protein